MAGKPGRPITRTLCTLCGNRFKSLAQHVRMAHPGESIAHAAQQQEVVPMPQQQCGSCTAYRLELEREQRESAEERRYMEQLQSQVNQLQQELQSTRQQMAQARQQTQQEVEQVKASAHNSCNSLFGCPTHGAEAIKELEQNPGLIPQRTAEKIIKHYKPHIFDPVTLDLGQG